MAENVVEKRRASVRENSTESNCEDTTNKDLLSNVLFLVVGQSTEKQHIPDNAIPADLLSGLYRVIQKPDCSASDVALFSAALSYLTERCGYVLKLIKPSLLFSAAEVNNMAVVLKLLLSHKAHYNEVNPANWETILHVACRLKSVLRYIHVVAFPDLLTMPDNNGNRPIHIACQKNDIQFISWLFKPILSNEACIYEEELEMAFIKEEAAAPAISPSQLGTKLSKLSSKNLAGRTVFHIAVSNNYSRLLGVLLDALESMHEEFGMDAVTTLDSEGNSPLHMAIELHHLECLRLLLEFMNKHGIVQKVAEEKQFLQTAADGGDVRTIELLVKYGFSLGLNDAIGRVKDKELKHLLLYYYTQLTSLRAILDAQPDYMRGYSTGKIQWNKVSVETIDATWVSDFSSAIQSIYQTIHQKDTSSQSLHDLSLIQDLSSKCLNWFESGKLCKQLDNRPAIPITSVEITHCSLKSVPIELFQLPNLEYLNLANNCISELPTALQFSACIYSSQSLKKLVLDANQLTTLPGDLALGLVNSLQYLSAQKNEISELPPGLWVMSQLKELNLSGNRLLELHYFSDYKYFKNREFSRCVLNSFGRSHNCMCNPSSVKETVSTDTTKNDVSRYLQLLNLFYQTLNAAANGKFNLKDFEEWICFVHTRRLMQECECICECQCKLPNATIHEEIEISVLTSLNISHNMFSEIPQDLPCLAPNLQTLNMSHNYIQHLNLIHTVPSNVVTVILTHNQIDTMDAIRPSKPFCLSSHMLLLQPQAMGICGCSHTTHTTLKSLLNLQLGVNKLNDFCATELNSDATFEETVICSVVVHFPQLSILSLEYNNLTSVPCSIMSLTSLNSLNLAHNTQIKSLPSRLGLLSLSALNLEGLSLAGIPINLLENCSPTYLLGYLKGIYHGTELYRHMKLMLVGPANAGKTTLLLQLTKKGKMTRHTKPQTRAKEGPQSTAGVELGEWEYSTDMSSPKVIFMTWDFGGQEEYHATHQRFVSHRSLYLVVWDAQEGDDGLKRISVWLENIEAQAHNAPVIVIGTHADCIKNTATLGENFRRLYVQCNSSSFAYPKIQPHCFFVNSFSSSDMKQLRKYIYEFTRTYRNPGARKDAPPILDEPIPPYYITLLKIIKAWATKCNVQNVYPVFTRNDYLSEIQKCNFSGSVQDILEASSFWHDNGIIFYHKSVTADELYCIDPQWLCAMLAKVITAQDKSSLNKGFMRHEDFANLYKRSTSRRRSTQSFIDALISIMQSFEVILLLDQQSILIPSLLSKHREEAWAISQDDFQKFSAHSCVGRDAIPITAHVDVLLRYYVLPFVPSGFIGRLISRICASRVLAKCKRMFGVDCDPYWSCWKDGVCLLCNNAEVLRIVSVTYPLPGVETTHIVNGSGPCAVSKSRGIEVRVAVKTAAVYALPVSARARSDADPAHAAAWLLEQAVEHIESIFDDWYEQFGKKRGFELSAIDQGAPCPSCEARRAARLNFCEESARVPEFTEQNRGLQYYVFSSAFCAHSAALKQDLQCPLHGNISVSQIAPDLVFGDFPHSMVYEADAITTGHVLGRGGYGSVSSGTIGKNVNASQSIAIKVFGGTNDPNTPPELLAWEKYQQASHEARVICRLIHDNILGLIGIVKAPLMLLLELAPLGDLKACIEKFHHVNEKLNIRTLSSTLIQIAKALDYIHSKSFVFRDLKPGNVLVWKFPLPETQCDKDAAVYIKLADYGICQQYTPQGVRGAGGTPPYLPPEVLLHGGQQTHSTKLDVYSFGMLMYYLISFQEPFSKESKSVSALLQEGERPSLSAKQCPLSLWLLELMCWCWSEHPYHRPDFKQIISVLGDVTTSRLASAFSIASYNPVVVSTCTKCIPTGQHSYSLSSSFSWQQLGQVPGYMYPFGHSKSSKRLFDQKLALDVWCACKDGLKCIRCQPYACTVEEIEPGECTSVVATSHDQVWVARVVSTGGRLCVYDAKKPCQLGNWHSRDIIRKLIYDCTRDTVVAITENELHVFAVRSLADDIKPVLSHPLAEISTEVVLIRVGEEYSVRLWCAVGSKLNDLELSPQLGASCETFREGGNKPVRHMAALHAAEDGAAEVTHVVLSHGSCVEKWYVQKRELLASYECYDFCRHLYDRYYDKSKVTALMCWKGVLYIGTVGGAIVALNSVDMAALWTAQASDAPVRSLLGTSLGREDEPGPHRAAPAVLDSLQHSTKSPNMIISFAEQYTGVTRDSVNVPPSLNLPGEPQSSNDARLCLKFLTATANTTHLFMWHV